MHKNKMSCSSDNLFLMLPILLYIFTLPYSTSSHNVLVAKMEHYQSENSPFYDPSATIADLAHDSVTSSLSRALHLSGAKNLFDHPDGLETNLISYRNGFLAEILVGTSEVRQLLYMDTGSNLLWINCVPCALQDDLMKPVYDPRSSTKYYAEGCSFCNQSAYYKWTCSPPDDRCLYRVNYGGQHYSEGYLVRDDLNFARNNDTIVNILFGCSAKTNLAVNGVLGLGNGPYSLMAQIAGPSRFAYCFGNLSNRAYEHNTLVLGPDVRLWGSQTPLTVEGKYYLTLEAIFIGDTQILFDPVIFVRNTTELTGGMMVDTGSTQSFFPDSLLTDIKRQLIILIGYDFGGLQRDFNILYEDWLNRFCYYGVFTRDLVGFPTTKLQFKGGAIMELTAENMFQQTTDSSFCLAILPSHLVGVSILGNLMQQYFYMAYDLGSSIMSFKRMDCQVVEYDYVHDEL